MKMVHARKGDAMLNILLSSNDSTVACMGNRNLIFITQKKLISKIMFRKKYLL